MSDELKIITNNVPRPLIEAYELSLKEQADFDYYDWSESGPIQRCESSPQFFRYKGQLYDLGEFTTEGGMMKGSPLPSAFAGWAAYMSDSFFSGLLIRWVTNDAYEEWSYIVVGQYFA